MSGYETNELSPEEQRIANSLQVVQEGQQRFITVGEARVPLPSVTATTDEMDRFNRFLAESQLGAIERKKQRNLREIRAEVEVEILRARTEAIIKAHKGLAAEALAEIVIAANQLGRGAVRRDQLSEQVNVQRAVLEAAVQYTEFIKEIPGELPEDVRSDVLDNALDVYNKTIEKIRNTTFHVDVDR